MIYESIGRVVVKAVMLLLRTRYRRQLRFAAGFAIAALLLGGYLASREVSEG